jgi:uncharacterized protein involved in exopolysaccharide biosynthesis
MVKVRGQEPSKAKAEGNLLPRVSRVERQPDLTFLDFLIFIVKRKKLVGIATAICAGIAVILAFALPPEYTATVTLFSPQGISATGSTQASSTNSTRANELSGKSGALGELASSTPETRKAPESKNAPENRNSSETSSTPEPRNINETIVSMMKVRAVEDAVIRQFGLQSEYRKNGLAETREVLENHTNIIGAAKDGLIRLSFTDHDASRSAEIANGYVEQFTSLSQDLAITEASRRRVLFENQLQRSKADLESAEDALKKTPLSTRAVKLDRQLLDGMDSAARLRAKIVTKEIQIEAMRWYAREDDPALNHVQTQLDGMRGQFKTLVGSEGETRDDLTPARGTAPQAALEYARRVRDVKYDAATLEAVAKQLELAKLDEARGGAFIQVLDAAVAPEKESYPHRAFIVGGGLAAGFTLGIMLALLQGGLLRMQQNAATRDKLELLKMSLWSGGRSSASGKLNAKQVGEKEEEVHSLGRA